jgi:hypothetical protein
MDTIAATDLDDFLVEVSGIEDSGIEFIVDGAGQIADLVAEDIGVIVLIVIGKVSFHRLVDLFAEQNRIDAEDDHGNRDELSKITVPVVPCC